jgi:AcrR family transcriptional regulator
MAAETRNSRARILEAAAELAREVGPGNISLDAVAQRAGLSKGGLLYNFPSKAKLMEALVEMHISRNREALGACRERHEPEPNALARAIVDVFREECRETAPPASGVLAAIAENPHFLDPIREHQRQLVARLKQESDDAELACLVFLMVEGMRCLRLFDIDAFTEEEADRLLQRMAELALASPGPDG